MSTEEVKVANERLIWQIQTLCPNHITLCVGKQGARSEVEGLAPMFKKSATEPKLKPKTLLT